MRVPDPSCCYPCRLSPLWIQAPFSAVHRRFSFPACICVSQLADHILSPRPPLQPRQHAIWHPAVARSDMHAVLLTPAVLGRYMHAELLSDEPNVSLAFHFSPGQRLKARPALAVQLSRRVEEQLGAFVLPSQIRSTILAICEPTIVAWSAAVLQGVRIVEALGSACKVGRHVVLAGTDSGVYWATCTVMKKGLQALEVDVHSNLTCAPHQPLASGELGLCQRGYSLSIQTTSASSRASLTRQNLWL